jgi:cellulase/cellobiase CelA1
MLSSDLELKQTVANDWGGGYCSTYEVKNVSSAPVTWSVPLEISGTLSQHWQSEVSGDSGTVTFTGASYNATLEPGASTQFGFCANR